jgi:hypothetical protein
MKKRGKRGTPSVREGRNRLQQVEAANRTPSVREGRKERDGRKGRKCIFFLVLKNCPLKGILYLLESGHTDMYIRIVYVL